MVYKFYTKWSYWFIERFMATTQDFTQKSNRFTLK